MQIKCLLKHKSCFWDDIRKCFGLSLSSADRDVFSLNKSKRFFLFFFCKLQHVYILNTAGTLKWKRAAPQRKMKKDVVFHCALLLSLVNLLHDCALINRNLPETTIADLLVSEGEFSLSVLQSSVVHPLLHQVLLGCSQRRFGQALLRQLRLRLLVKVKCSRGRLVSAGRKTALFGCLKAPHWE